IKWLGHASFLISGEGKRIITDPYDPSITKLYPVDDAADIVVRSSDDDQAHCYVQAIPGEYVLLTATDYIAPNKTEEVVDGIPFRFIPSRESVIHKEVARENAFYRFALEGIEIAHLGDIGNAMTDEQIDFLRGTDILLALAGGPPTIELKDLFAVIEAIQPRLVVPMHYRIPGPEFFMLPIDELISYFDQSAVHWAGESEIELRKGTLPAETQLLILEPSKVKE
ncbi:MAG: MBL fold metallo-hydrolase, partial [Spirochaetia bacterium]